VGSRGGADGACPRARSGPQRPPQDGEPRIRRYVLRTGPLVALLVLLGLASPARAILFYTPLPPNGSGKAQFCPPRPIDPSAVGVPCGYRIEPVVTGLTYPTAVATDEYDRLYVLEAGYSYGEDFKQPRLLRVDPNGTVATVAVGRNNGPWTGMSYHQGAFYVSEGGEVEGGRILRITPDGQITALVEGLPSMGDHHTNRPVVGPDGYVYFGVGTATNSGVAGPDNVKFGWLRRHPQLCEVPPVDVVLTGQNFVSDNLLKPGAHEPVETGAYVPYGTKTFPGQIIPGRLPCNGAILRVPLSGGPMQRVAWGFRNPFGLAFAPDGQLYTTDNLYDERGFRPVYGAADLLWRVQPGPWYGFPDYWDNIPLSHPRFEEKPHRPRPSRLLAQHPNVPPEPVARLGVRSSSDGMDLSRTPQFGHVGQAFVAVFGDISGPPDNGKVRRPVGCRVIRTQIRVGLGVMPGFSECEIPPADMDALIAYLKTSRKSAGFCPPVGPCELSPLGR
jgi:glucose/arabinose dehydrogenase